MTDLYAVEVEPDVRVLLEALFDRDFGRVDTLGEPYTRHLRGQQTCERSHGIAHDSFDRNGDTL